MEKKQIIDAIEEMEREARRRGAAIYKAIEELEGKSIERFFFVILSTRTRDGATLNATRRLFEGVKRLEDICSMSVEEVERRIRGVGFYKVKARNIKSICNILIEDFGGRIPKDRRKLMSLPGVGRKVANVVLADIFSEKVIGVDVHVHRISNRLGWVNTKKPEETEEELKKVVPKEYWNRVNMAMVGYGQTVCLPKQPRCEECRLKKMCRFYTNK